MKNKRIVEASSTVMLDVISGTLMAVLVLLLASPQKKDMAPENPVATITDKKNARIDSLTKTIEALRGKSTPRPTVSSPISASSSVTERYKHPINVVLRWNDPAVFAFLELSDGKKSITFWPNERNPWSGWYAKVMTRIVGAPEHIIYNNEMKEGEYKILLNITVPPETDICELSGYSKVYIGEKPIVNSLPVIRATPGEKVRRLVLGTLVVTGSGAVFKPNE